MQYAKPIQRVKAARLSQHRKPLPISMTTASGHGGHDSKFVAVGGGIDVSWVSAAKRDDNKSGGMGICAMVLSLTGP